MNYQIFDHDDQAYFSWVNQNPEGYVLNTGKSNNSKYYMIHKADCSHIRNPLKRYPPGGFTERDEMKVCSKEPGHLLAFIEQNRPIKGIKVNNCKSCNSIGSNILIDNVFPEQILPKKKFFEGAQKTITVVSYERDQDARNECIRVHGAKCKVCDFNFEKKYGILGRGFIHVHHLVPISQIGETYKIDPINDLVPVCPNCHAMLHRGGKGPLEIEELKEILLKNSSNNKYL